MRPHRGVGRIATIHRRQGAMHAGDALWLCAMLVDMRLGTERLLAHVVHALGSVHAHHGHMSANARATRIKTLVHDGFAVWYAATRLNAGRFVWPAR